MKKLLLLALVWVLILTNTALAGDGSGVVRSIQVWDEWVNFITDFHDAPPQACKEQMGYTFPLATPSGRAKLALLLSAKATGKTIHVWGSNTCSGLFGTIEEAILIQLNEF
jgi:hypothetical protein